MPFFSSKQHKQHFFLELSGMFNCCTYNVTETSQHILVVVSYLGHGSHTHGRLDHEPILVSLLSGFDLEKKEKKMRENDNIFQLCFKISQKPDVSMCYTL